MDKLKEFWYKVYDKLLFPIERFFRQLKLTWDWYWQVLRHDNDWDWTYICKVIKYKFERTRKCLEQGHHLHRERDAKQIRICELLLDRIEKNDYCFSKQHVLKWGELTIEWQPTNNPDITRSVISRANVKNEKQEEQERKERKLIDEHEEYMGKQDLEYLGKLLTKWLKNWWD